MKFVASARPWSLGAILLVVTLVVAAALTGTSRAGSVRTSVDVEISPHVLTAGQRGLITIKFVNSGPSTVNHVLATVNAGTGNLPLPSSAFTGLPTGCSVTPGASTVLT